MGRSHYDRVSSSDDDESASDTVTTAVKPKQSSNSQSTMKVVVAVLAACVIGAVCVFAGKVVLDKTDWLSSTSFAGSSASNSADNKPAEDTNSSPVLCKRRTKRDSVGIVDKLAALDTSRMVQITRRGTTVSSWFRPSLKDTFLYDIETAPIDVPVVKSNTGVKLNATVYIVDMSGTSAAQIAAYKKAGKRIACYFSAGSWEPWRADALQFNPACYCGAGQQAGSDGRCKTSKNQLNGWDEWWLDIHSAQCLAQVKTIQTKRMQDAKAKGCDALDPDNVDGFDNDNAVGITQQDSVNYVRWLAQTGHSLGMAVGLKNAAALVPSVVKDVDFSVTESCLEYDECDSYAAFGLAGKPQIDIEYGSKYKKCPSGSNVPKRMLQYSKDALNHKWITLNCQD